jgi:hypothetical protein
VAALALALGGVAVSPAPALADEDGVSFWLPGLFGSLAAAPQQPGWSLSLINYYTAVRAGADVATAREITIGKLTGAVNARLNVTLNADADIGLIYPSYVFATPLFGGQLSLGMIGFVGDSNVGLNGTLTLGSGPFSVTRQGSRSDFVVGVGDLYPVATLRWNDGANNLMLYAAGDIPVGAYNSSDLANLGIGHGAADGGVGYTYFNPQTGHEFSVVTGFTYNLINAHTNYQNGIDWHTDWGISQFLTKQFQVGAVGYVYEQISPDSGSGDRVGSFESRVIGIGPQVGFIIPAGSVQAYINVKAYFEFDAQNRPSGWNAWVTLSLSPSAPAPTNPRSAMLTK